MFPSPVDLKKGPAFELADLLYIRDQMSATNINDLLQVWAATLSEDQDPPFVNKEDLYETINLVEVGEVPWQSFSVSYQGAGLSDPNSPSWKHAAYDVWFRDPRLVIKQQLGNRDFANEMDFAPKLVRDEHGTRRYTDFMSGNFAWRQADKIGEDPATHGATFCPVILSSDKTTNDYYPLYVSNGLVHNNVHQAHRNALMLLGFLAIPKSK
ncbi:hypothetical protein CPB84DRAFT_1815450 [Gymnopilus junonius]|uniref:Uncharacterized protein n=1 Tax=Gymnopilus junonius TaxID=109634 RepID=A0A9P5NQ29_GYMJU|nr:hypothetical protein CPB84DRAFT_1815450 [Gymnopilus junonius]